MVSYIAKNAPKKAARNGMISRPGGKPRPTSLVPFSSPTNQRGAKKKSERFLGRPNALPFWGEKVERPEKGALAKTTLDQKKDVFMPGGVFPVQKAKKQEGALAIPGFLLSGRDRFMTRQIRDTCLTTRPKMSLRFVNSRSRITTNSQALICQAVPTVVGFGKEKARGPIAAQRILRRQKLGRARRGNFATGGDLGGPSQEGQGAPGGRCATNGSTAALFSRFRLPMISKDLIPTRRSRFGQRGFQGAPGSRGKTKKFPHAVGTPSGRRERMAKALQCSEGPNALRRREEPGRRGGGGKEEKQREAVGGLCPMTFCWPAILDSVKPTGHWGIP